MAKPYTFTRKRIRSSTPLYRLNEIDINFEEDESNLTEVIEDDGIENISKCTSTFDEDLEAITSARRRSNHVLKFGRKLSFRNKCSTPLKSINELPDQSSCNYSMQNDRPKEPMRYFKPRILLRSRSMQNIEDDISSIAPTISDLQLSDDHIFKEPHLKRACLDESVTLDRKTGGSQALTDTLDQSFRSQNGSECSFRSVESFGSDCSAIKPPRKESQLNEIVDSFNNITILQNVSFSQSSSVDLRSWGTQYSAFQRDINSESSRSIQNIEDDISSIAPTISDLQLSDDHIFKEPHLKRACLDESVTLDRKTGGSQALTDSLDQSFRSQYGSQCSLRSVESFGSDCSAFKPPRNGSQLNEIVDSFNNNTILQNVSFSPSSSVGIRSCNTHYSAIQRNINSESSPIGIGKLFPSDSLMSEPISTQKKLEAMKTSIDRLGAYIEQAREQYENERFNENATNAFKAFDNTAQFLDDLSQQDFSQASLERVKSSQPKFTVETVKIRPFKSKSKKQPPMNSCLDQKFEKSFEKINSDENLFYTGPKFIKPYYEMRRSIAVRRIEEIFSHLRENKNDKTKFQLLVPCITWSNCDFKNNMLVVKSDPKWRKIKPTKHVTFKLVLYLLKKILNILMIKATITKRELYYQCIKYLKNQAQVNNAIIDISYLLKMPPWEFGVYSTTKGLVYGNVKLVFDKQDSINCNAKGGTLIPHSLNNLTAVHSNAKFILIVEKDSIFQKLLDEQVSNKLSKPFILITAKGYPDLSTRYFIKCLWKMLAIPVFILVDGDPHGIEIMCSYRFGTLSSVYLSEKLALPSLRWIGVHPTEIDVLEIDHKPLTANDRKKLNSLQNRPYIKHNKKLKEQISHLLRKGYKAETEGLIKCNQFLSNFYLPNKLYALDYI